MIKKSSFNDTQFLKACFDFNFFFLTDNSLESQKNINRYLKNFIKSKDLHVKSSAVLEPTEILKSFKQTIRILQYLNKQKDPTLHLNFKNIYLFDWFNFLLQRDKSKTTQLNKISLRRNSFLQKSATSSVIFNIEKLRSSSAYKNLLFQNIFIITNINSRLFAKDTGIYKIYNDLNDWKKLVFFFILIKTIYKK